jgi:hypothetical protein
MSWQSRDKDVSGIQVPTIDLGIPDYLFRGTNQATYLYELEHIY